MAKRLVRLSNGRVWPTQTAALDHFRTMLRRYGDGNTIEERDDHDDLVALLERYDAAIVDGPSKIGVGVDCFLRRRNAGEGYSTPGFWVRRVDGTETDFSFPTAVRGEPKSPQQEFYDACRNAVAADLVAAKRAHFKSHGDADGRVPCEVTDELISFEEAHLDHAYPTFGLLVVSFRAANGWQQALPQGLLTLPDNAQTTTRFREADVAERFRDFHRGAALLRVISGKRNLSMAAGQRRPKVRRPVVL